MFSRSFKRVGLHYTAFRNAIREDSRQTAPSRGVSPRKKFAVEANVESRVKTPITSISLCAELARDGRVSEERERECAETIFAEATKLDRIVGEVLNHIEGGRHG